MIYIIEFLTKILDLVLDYSAQKNRNEQQEQYNSIRDNPRDLFDDGVLNNSDNKQSTAATVSEDHSTRQP